MSPEQARGEAVDHRVDIYAMGCILFQLVTGRVPFEADNFMGVLSLHLTEPPPVIPPEVFDSIGAPRALAAVIDQALAKDRNQRFATIDEFARAVRRASGDKATGPVVAQPSVPAPPSTATMGRVRTQWTGNLSVPERDAPPPRRSKLPLVVGAIVLAGGAAVAAAVLVTRGGSSAAGPAAASQVADHGAPPAGSAPPAQPAHPAAPTVEPRAPAGEPPLTFEWSEIRLDSTPPGAEVKDLTSDKVIGRTPLPFKVRPSRTARQFALHRRDYVDAVVELVPDRPRIEYTEKLERGTGAPAVIHRAGEPALKPLPTAGSKPDATRPDTTRPDATKPDTAAAGKPEPAARPARPPAPPPDDDCGDPPCLKRDPSRLPGGSAAP
jgi:serine/threonine-protein kinase